MGRGGNFVGNKNFLEMAKVFFMSLFNSSLQTDCLLLTANSGPGTSASLSCIHYRGCADALRQSRTFQRLLLNPLVAVGPTLTPVLQLYRIPEIIWSQPKFFSHCCRRPRLGLFRLAAIISASRGLLGTNKENGFHVCSCAAEV